MFVSMMIFAAEVNEMTERESLTNDICGILISADVFDEEIKQRIVLAIDNYEIQRRTTEIVVADPNDNANLLKRFAVAKAVAGRSKKTINQYTWPLKKFIEITKKQLLDIVPDDFRAYLAHRMIVNRISPVTLNNERNNLSAFYDWAVSSDLINRNPVKATDPIKVPREQKQAFSEMELEKIRNACETLREKALVETLLSTACRVSELASIQTADIDGNRIMVVGKGNKRAQVYLNSKATYAINAYINSRTDNSPYLFPSRAGKGITAQGVRFVLKSIGERAGVDNVHPHRFRRTAATMALRHGMPIEMVSRMLRHDKLQTTMIYLDLDERELQYQHQKYVG